MTFSPAFKISSRKDGRLTSNQYVRPYWFVNRRFLTEEHKRTSARLSRPRSHEDKFFTEGNEGVTGKTMSCGRYRSFSLRQRPFFLQTEDRKGHRVGSFIQTETKDKEG